MLFRLKTVEFPLAFYFFVSLTLLVIIVQCSQVFAQQNDAKKQIVSYESFISQILQSHPVAAQAALLNEMAVQQIRLSKGLLDPTINSKYTTKTLDQKDYYYNWTNELKSWIDQNYVRKAQK